MICNKILSFSLRRVLAVCLTALVIAPQAGGQTFLTIDGRDAATLAGDGNHATFHNPPVNFAFTFGGVAADNPEAGPGDPPTAAETSFIFTGNDSASWDLEPPRRAISPFPPRPFSRWTSLSIAATRSRRLSSIFKDADTLSPVQVHLIEEHQ